MNLKPFTDTQMGVSGLIPEGWAISDELGLFLRETDQTVFYQRGIPDMTVAQIKAIFLPEFGISSLPEPPGNLKTTHFVWDFYVVNDKKESGVEAPVADIALAQVGSWVYVVLFNTPADDYQALHETLFMPALEALTPLFTGQEAELEAARRSSLYAQSIHETRSGMKANLSVSDYISDQLKGLEMPPAQKAYEKDAQLIDLPQPDKTILKKSDIRSCIADRKSRRKFSDENLTQGELAYLLWATQGIRIAPSNSKRHYRTVPSAGSRHSFETYLIIQHVEGLKSGVYRYLPFEHKLLYLFSEENLPQKLTGLASGQPFVGNSAVCFIWSSIPYRMEWRYGKSSERVILMDVGHVCQNLYLACESINCGTCAVAAYEQDEMDKFLRLDGEDEFVIYLAPIGKLNRSANSDE